MAERHVSDAEWTRIWAHTLSAQDRRRITRAVQSGAVLDDPAEALVAAELARQMRTPKPPPRALLWFNIAFGLALLALLAVRWPDVGLSDWLLPGVFALNTLAVILGRRAQPQAKALREVEQRNLQRHRAAESSVPHSPPD